MRNKIRGVGVWFRLRSQTERDCHDLCLTEEKTTDDKYSEGCEIPSLPAVGQLRSNILEIGVPHVVDPKDVDVRVLGNTFLNRSVKSQREIFAFLRRFGEMDDFGAL